MAELNKLKPVLGLLLLFISQSVCVIDTFKDAMDNAQETVNDLLLEPVADAIDNHVDRIQDMHENTKEQLEEMREKLEEMNENVVNPYKEIMEMFKIKTPMDFTETVLDTFLDTFVSKFHCKFGLFKRAAMCTNTMVSCLIYPKWY